MGLTLKNLALTAALLLGETVLGLTPAEWRSQSIYFMLTDRFGRSDNSTTAACNVSDRVCLPLLIDL
jgi:alpha-amylase